MMDFVTPLVTIFSSLIENISGRVTTAEKLHNSIVALETALEELTEVRDDLKKQVDRAESLGLTRTNQVKGWLDRVEKVEAEVRLIREDMEQKKQSLLCCDTNCLSRYALVQKVKETLLLVNDLKGKGNLEVDLADGLLLVPVVEMPSRPAVGLELMLDKVRQLLSEETVGTIGLYGMGGVGKTTLLKCINNGFLYSDHDFDVVIWATVSKEFVIEKIQQAIGERLGLSWDETQFQELRASRIYSVMRKKKFLLLLDDVWEGLDLEKIGIPIPSEENRSKVVFTTRSLEVCSFMDADYKLKVEFLNEKESWKLFQQKAGGSEILNSPLISAHAHIIVRKCGGLPLALVTIGRAMASKKTEEEWRYAVEVLNKTPSEVRGMEDVFTLLKFSYDNLDNDILRSCLLYCSLFPGDYFIEKEQLIEYWVGEGFLDCLQNGNLHIAGHAIIGALKVACFLETGAEESQVKIHDVVRSFALWIASENSNNEKFIMLASEGLSEAPCAESWKEAERISLLDNEITDLSEIPTCPNLSTLLLQWNNGLSRISDGFFQHMPVLRVLDLSFTSIKELPRSICKLSEIHHLDLSGTKLRTLPRELGSLKQLRHLNMQRNQYLRTISREAISGLCQLRVLNFYYSYSAWEMHDFDVSSELKLMDLECLKNLDSLGITITNLSALSKVSFSKSLRECIQYLYIKECEGLYDLPLSLYPGDGDKLRRLSINNCTELRHLEINEAAGQNWLPNLEILALNGLPSLTSIWKNRVSLGCLLNLRCVNIWHCEKLKNVSWTLRLPKLETLYIFYCKEMEEVISGEDVAEEEYLNAFPKLKIMSIRDVPGLRSICHNTISFPCLKNIAIIDCPKLRKLPFEAHTVSKLPTVYCYKGWWDNLVWDDDDTKHTFLPYFTAA
ncbi:Disease resistance protein RPS2 [Sesamum angolense]|uniref:Disease resistance protein RPS2 n=1 Tax=Sesamum angolense TaxID=2727404 RepID=A0AAE1WNY7_9LAMI|nr:Disease resistance protein RPS2 [Sesamum angolense]